LVVGVAEIDNADEDIAVEGFLFAVITEVVNVGAYPGSAVPAPFIVVANDDEFSKSEHVPSGSAITSNH